jgi:hypothetical protein
LEESWPVEKSAHPVVEKSVTVNKIIAGKKGGKGIYYRYEIGKSEKRDCFLSVINSPQDK